MDEAIDCLACTELKSLQIIFNMLRQKPIDVLFEKAQSQGVAIIVRLPLASGVLSGKFSHATTFPESDHRNFNRDGQKFNVGETFAGVPFTKAIELVDEIRAIIPASLSLPHSAAMVSRPRCRDHRHPRCNPTRSGHSQCLGQRLPSPVINRSRTSANFLSRTRRLAYSRCILIASTRTPPFNLFLGTGSTKNSAGDFKNRAFSFGKPSDCVSARRELLSQNEYPQIFRVLESSADPQSPAS